MGRRSGALRARRVRWRIAERDVDSRDTRNRGGDRGDRGRVAVAAHRALLVRDVGPVVMHGAHHTCGESDERDQRQKARRETTADSEWNVHVNERVKPVAAGIPARPRTMRADRAPVKRRAAAPAVSAAPAGTAEPESGRSGPPDQLIAISRMRAATFFASKQVSASARAARL